MIRYGKLNIISNILGLPKYTETRLTCHSLQISVICFFGCKAFRSTNMLFYLFVTFLVDVCRLPGPYILTGSHTNPSEFIAQSKFREAECDVIFKAFPEDSEDEMK